MRIRAIIASVGGTAEPIVRTIIDFEPEKVYFIVSQGRGGSIKQVEEGGDILQETSHIAYDKVIFPVEYPEKLVSSYMASLKAVSQAVEEFSPGEILVNYTGGTKCMSAALVLASMDFDLKHCYIGGTIRDEVGRVRKGYEKVFFDSNPRIALGVNDIREAMLLFDKNAITEAERKLQEADRGFLPEISRVIEDLRCLVRAYLEWDRFDHVKSKRWFERCNLDLFDDELRTHIKENINFLDGLLRRSQGKERLCTDIILDLISSAERRAEEGRYDDAIARLYRALEVMAQYRLEEMGYNASDMRIDDGQLREKYRRYEDEKGVIRLPLTAGFEFLRDQGDEWGKIFFDEFDGFRKHLNLRNLSILAHGMEKREKEEYLKFKEEMKRFVERCGIGYAEIAFPKFTEWVAKSSWKAVVERGEAPRDENHV